MAENNEGVGAAPEGGAGDGVAIADNSLSTEQIQELKAKADKADQLERDLASTKKDYKRLSKTLEETKAALDPEEKSQDKNQQPNEPDYSKIAFLNSIDVKHPDDQKLVMDEANRLKLPLNDIANMEHVKARLADASSKRDTQAGMPNRTGRTGGTVGKDVQFFLENPDQVPSDSEMHNKVIDARMKQVDNTNKWGPAPFVG